MQPIQLAADAQAGLVEAAHFGLSDPCADSVIDGFKRPGLAANPCRHARSASCRGVEQILKDLRDPFFRHELLGVEINRRRSDTFAILRRRGDPCGEGRSRLAATVRTTMYRRAMLGHFNQPLGKVEDLPPFDADGRTVAKPRAAMLAHSGRVFDDSI